MGAINILYGGKGETFHFCLWAEAQSTQMKTSELYWRFFFSFDLIYFVDILGGGGVPENNLWGSCLSFHHMGPRD